MNNTKLRSGYWTVILIILTIVTIKANPSVSHTPEDEQRLITQLYNYVDLITSHKINKILKNKQIYAVELLDSIPRNERGNMPAELQQNILQSKEQKNTVAQKKQLLQDMDLLISSIGQVLQRQKLDEQTLQKHVDSLNSSMRATAVEEIKFHIKFKKAAKLFPQKFSPTAAQRHRELFNVLEEISAQEDYYSREYLLQRFQDIKFNEIQSY